MQGLVVALGLVQFLHPSFTTQGFGAVPVSGWCTGQLGRASVMGKGWVFPPWFGLPRPIVISRCPKQQCTHTNKTLHRGETAGPRQHLRMLLGCELGRHCTRKGHCISTPQLGAPEAKG